MQTRALKCILKYISLAIMIGEHTHKLSEYLLISTDMRILRYSPSLLSYERCLPWRLHPDTLQLLSLSEGCLRSSIG